MCRFSLIKLYRKHFSLLRKCTVQLCILHANKNELFLIKRNDEPPFCVEYLVIRVSDLYLYPKATDVPLQIKKSISTQCESTHNFLMMKQNKLNIFKCLISAEKCNSKMLLFLNDIVIIRTRIVFIFRNEKMYTT